jgi:serine/threonine protein phosphatase PrpC
VSRVGSCALAAVVVDDKLYAANVGDCKGVICHYDKRNKKVICRKINQKFNANSKKE